MPLFVPQNSSRLTSIQALSKSGVYKLLNQLLIILNLFLATGQQYNSSKQFSLSVNLYDNNYFSLDDPKIHKNIYSIDSYMIIDCNNHTVNLGDFYIGTSRSTYKDLRYKANSRTKDGFIFSRKVIGINIDEYEYEIDFVRCWDLLTVNVDPVELLKVSWI
jgi:hypothetical protein